MGTDRNENPLNSHLAALFEENAPRLSGAVRGILGHRADTQEVLQEAFLSAWRALGRGTRPHDPVAWIFVLTLNLARDQRRKAFRRGPHQKLDEVDEAMMRVDERDPAKTLIENESIERAREAIYQLEESQKEVFLLRVSGGLSFEAVADALSIPLGTAKSRMRAALGRLRERMHDLGPEALPSEGETR